MTTRRDDRVHPGHARKMAAKLQAMGYPALFYEPPAGGHGYGKDNGEVASFSRARFGFPARGDRVGDPVRGLETDDPLATGTPAPLSRCKP